MNSYRAAADDARLIAGSLHRRKRLTLAIDFIESAIVHGLPRVPLFPLKKERIIERTLIRISIPLARCLDDSLVESAIVHGTTYCSRDTHFTARNGSSVSNFSVLEQRSQEIGSVFFANRSTPTKGRSNYPISHRTPYSVHCARMFLDILSNNIRAGFVTRRSSRARNANHFQRHLAFFSLETRKIRAAIAQGFGVSRGYRTSVFAGREEGKEAALRVAHSCLSRIA